MLVFSNLSIQLLMNWLGRCAAPFILSPARWRLWISGVKAPLDSYLRGRQGADLWGTL